MNDTIPLWIEAPVALLLVLGGVFTLAAAVGVVRFNSFFMRMHPPALAFTFATWCMALASILYFSWQTQGLSLHALLIIVFLSLTVPVTTTLLARTELFRRRTSPETAGDVPAPLSHVVQPAQDAGAGQTEPRQHPYPNPKP